VTGTLGAMPDDPHAALARLEPLVGEWTLESPIAPGQTGRSVFEWALGGAFLLERSEAPDPAPNGLTIVAPDGRMIEGRWEKSDDGRNWELDFELVHRRT
jgi:hypothetical protein